MLTASILSLVAAVSFLGRLQAAPARVLAKESEKKEHEVGVNSICSSHHEVEYVVDSIVTSQYGRGQQFERSLNKCKGKQTGGHSHELINSRAKYMNYGDCIWNPCWTNSETKYGKT